MGRYLDSTGKIKIQLSVLVYYKVDLIIIISLKINLLSPRYIRSIELVLNNNHITHSLIGVAASCILHAKCVVSTKP